MVKYKKYYLSNTYCAASCSVAGCCLQLKYRRLPYYWQNFYDKHGVSSTCDMKTNMRCTKRAPVDTPR